MSVDHTALAGIGFEVNYKDRFRDEVLAKFGSTATNTNIGLIDDFEHEDFRLVITGDYNYTGDIDDLGLLIIKHQYNDPNDKFISAINDYFQVEFKEEDIDVVKGVLVW